MESCAHGSVEHIGGDGYITLPIASSCVHTPQGHISHMNYLGGTSGTLCGYCSIRWKMEGLMKRVRNILSMSLNFCESEII